MFFNNARSNLNVCLLLAAIVECLNTHTSAAVTAAESARQIIDDTGIKGGLIVHVGCGDGKLTAALRINERYQVQGIDSDSKNVAAARKYIKSQGHYGEVTVTRFDGKRLPYINNLVNVIVSSDLGKVPFDEVIRVLAPHGVAYIKDGNEWKKTIKPRPKNIDEWTHYFHDSSGNAVAHDTVVGPPEHLQWIGSPRWSRHHDRMASMSALVATKTRIFYIMDEGSRVSIQLPAKWKLIARDAFNGTILWKRDIKKWQNHLWPLKSGPTQLARRLVASGETVYVTFGLEAPLTAVSASTGETIRTYEGTKSTEEVILNDGQLFMLVNRGRLEVSNYFPLNNVGDQGRVAREWQWNGDPREIVSVEADTGKLLWKKKTRVTPLTLTANKKGVFFHDGEKVVCFDRANGDEKWRSGPAGRRSKINLNFGPKLVLYGDVVLFAGGDRKMHAYSMETGKELWTAPHAQSGYQSPEDLLVVDGLVWSAPTTRTGDSGVFTGRNPLTGLIKSEFAPDIDTYWFHHRCYGAKATDKYLLTSRTGIEFIDTKNKEWEIHHWVRGGCHYGIMPCNGLMYTPPHDCACFPEIKLFGLNVLAPTSPTRKLPKVISDVGRLERGPAFKDELPPDSKTEDDWPMYRHDEARSGHTKAEVAGKLERSWKTHLGGRLSTVVAADGQLFVAQIDTHTVYALNAQSGEVEWSFMAGGRVDSPPTINRGRILFGAADGFVYCLRAKDGELCWRFRAAPEDRRLMAMEQLESVWPVHGSVLVENNVVSFVAGRSNFLDGGLRLFRLDAKTGYKLLEKVIDDRDPDTGKNLQTRAQVLNMPVGLPDVLSSDGSRLFMRSQQFDHEGNRPEIGPHSGVPAQQGSVQRGETAHLFSPTGFLDGSWFHRSYWVFGRSFAGGHAGYYQAGKYAPSGRLLVFNDTDVFGFGRKPQYLKWTTILEHQLFAASKIAPKVAVPQQTRQRRGGATMVQYEKNKSLDPTGQAIAVEAWIKPEKPAGTVIARGGPTRGYALVLRKRRPQFIVRVKEEIFSVTAKAIDLREWTHLAATLGKDKQLSLYVNGKLQATGKASGLIVADPAQTLEVGADALTAVGDYKSPFGFTGTIDEVRLYHGEVTADEIRAHFENPGETDTKSAKLIVASSFNKGEGVDKSGFKNNGTVKGAKLTRGKVGGALRFAGNTRGGGGRSGGSSVTPRWTQDVPVLVRGMVLANKTLFVIGPPDVLDEEASFKKLTERDDKVHLELAKQQAALEGKQGAILRAISTTDGSTLAEYNFGSLPVWDGLIATKGRLFLSTENGNIESYVGK